MDTAPIVADNQLLKTLYEEDQADRKPAPGKQIDWPLVVPRDEAREVKVKELISAGALSTGADYYHAAMIFQHAPRPDDSLLCHDLCIVAIGKGEERAKWLAAASMDRFLVRIDRPQRFGTQFGSDRPFSPMHLRRFDPEVSDALRREFNVPSLDEARERESKMLKHFEKMNK